jgi:hypothetical protein
LANDGGEKKIIFRAKQYPYIREKLVLKMVTSILNLSVPKDINYAFGGGKISYYAHDSLIDASGFVQ